MLIYLKWCNSRKKKAVNNLVAQKQIFWIMWKFYVDYFFLCLKLQKSCLLKSITAINLFSIPKWKLVVETEWGIVVANVLISNHFQHKECTVKYVERKDCAENMVTLGWLRRPKVTERAGEEPKSRRRGIIMNPSNAADSF